MTEKKLSFSERITRLEDARNLLAEVAHVLTEECLAMRAAEKRFTEREAQRARPAGRAPVTNLV